MEQLIREIKAVEKPWFISQRNYTTDKTKTVVFWHQRRSGTHLHKLSTVVAIWYPKGQRPAHLKRFL